MRIWLALPLLLALPLTAHADDVAPAPTDDVAPVGGPGTVAPASAPAPVAAPAPVDGDPCTAYRRWGHHPRGWLSLGFSAGHVELGDDTDGHQTSVVARLTGRRGWSIELELARLSLDGGDTAKTAGASIVKTFGRHHVAPYVLAGVGGGRIDAADGSDSHVRFAELGGGLMLRGRRVSLGVDVRRGVRHVEDGDEMAARTTAATTDDDRNHYVRGRILALINF